ncbi:unnamed protein product [Toxocara canis]|uniref:Uncharacterized protein n=1 Tax=Toxocara canis TaxID=6265 RepID=A0A183U1I6_TOXCA|nr:unnamed protein product [Toxocara canis]
MRPYMRTPFEKQRKSSRIWGHGVPISKEWNALFEQSQPHLRNSIGAKAQIVHCIVIPAYWRQSISPLREFPEEQAD